MTLVLYVCLFILKTVGGNTTLPSPRVSKSYGGSCGVNTSQGGSLLRSIQWPRAEELNKSTAMCSLPKTIM